MSSGIRRTVDLLATTDNHAALDLLLQIVLHGPALREISLDLILTHKDREFLFHLVANFHLLTDEQRLRIEHESSRMGSAVRKAFLDADEQIHQNACSLIREIPDYDQISLLFGSLTSDNRRKQEASDLVDFLSQRMIEELALPPEERSHHDLERIQSQFLDAIVHSVERFAQHHAAEAPRALLMIADDNNELAATILRDDIHPCHRAAVAILRNESHPRLLRWIYVLLGSRRAPVAIMGIIRDRDDEPFVKAILDGFPDEPSAALQQSLKQVVELRWLHPDHPLLLRVSPKEQAAALKFAMLCGIPAEQKLELVALLLDSTDSTARLAAAESLVHVPGSHANQLVLACLDDEEPAVQAAAARQLRDRNIPNALVILMAKLDSPEPRIQQAARLALSDYTFERFLGSYEDMDENARRVAGSLILKVDPNWRTALEREMTAPYGHHRKRATHIIRQLDITDRMIQSLVSMMADSDHMVRREAIETMLSASDPSFIEQLVDSASAPRDQRRHGAREAIERLARNSRVLEVRGVAQAAARRLGLKV